MLGLKAPRAALFAVPIFVLASCGEENTFVPPPPPKVTVAEPLTQEVTDYLEFTGTTEATAYVEVPARVPGVLQEMRFEVGSAVEAGESLFVIDPEEYAAQVAVEEAALAQAKARKVENDKTLARAQALITRGNISQAKVDEAEANALSADADVKAAEAKLLQAQINLGYTDVTAPIGGRVGRNLVDVGNLVGEGEATILTDITTYDPMYVYFNLNERDLLQVMARFRKEMADSGENPDEPGEVRETLPLELGLANENGFPHIGETDFAESRVDPATGTLQIRGVFENPGRQPKLIPGLFARVRMPIGKRDNLPLVSERAIGADQSGQFVLVVNSENEVEKRNVELGALVDGLRVIEVGVQASDRVVVNGMQRARPGATVEPEATDMASLKTSVLKEQMAKSEAGSVAEPEGVEAEAIDDAAADGAKAEASDGEAADGAEPAAAQ